MKSIVSIVLILSYLLLPPLCLGNPCDSHDETATLTYALAGDSDAADGAQEEPDDCAGACCCSDHFPAGNLFFHSPAVAVTPRHTPGSYVDSVPEEIFVPPRS